MDNQASVRITAEATVLFVPACICQHSAGAHGPNGCEGWHPVHAGVERDECACRSYTPRVPPQELTIIEKESV